MSAAVCAVALSVWSAHRIGGQRTASAQPTGQPEGAAEQSRAERSAAGWRTSKKRPFARPSLDSLCSSLLARSGTTTLASRHNSPPIGTSRGQASAAAATAAAAVPSKLLGLRKVRPALCPAREAPLSSGQRCCLLASSLLLLLLPLMLVVPTERRLGVAARGGSAAFGRPN